MSISIHAPRVGSDWKKNWIITVSRYFNPRSPCGERPYATYNAYKNRIISIHAPRVGSDPQKGEEE